MVGQISMPIHISAEVNVDTCCGATPRVQVGTGNVTDLSNQEANKNNPHQPEAMVGTLEGKPYLSS